MIAATLQLSGAIGALALGWAVHKIGFVPVLSTVFLIGSINIYMIGQPVVSVLMMFVVVATHWLIRQMLCGRATRADAGLAAADSEARDQYVVLSENVERREQDRLMHDTILNTLTAIARSGGSPAVISQCRQDIGLLRSALSDSDITHDRGRPGFSQVDAIETVAGEMRARGLAVDLEITGGAAARGTPEPGLVPDSVVAAIAHATREALANVAAHAGTGQAWVTVTLTPTGDPTRAPRRFRSTG